nr:hypothetical protein [Gorillibacterium massiliense]
MNDPDYHQKDQQIEKNRRQDVPLLLWNFRDNQPDQGVPICIRHGCQWNQMRGIGRYEQGESVFCNDVLFNISPVYFLIGRRGLHSKIIVGEPVGLLFTHKFIVACLLGIKQQSDYEKQIKQHQSPRHRRNLGNIADSDTVSDKAEREEKQQSEYSKNSSLIQKRELVIPDVLTC